MTIQTIYPYIDANSGYWVFDDPAQGLEREPFVQGADQIIDRMVVQIPDAEAGFELRFSDRPFDGDLLILTWVDEDIGGNWYYSPGLDIEGWLCPALLRYFERAPRLLFVEFRPKPSTTKRPA